MRLFCRIECSLLLCIKYINLNHDSASFQYDMTALHMALTDNRQSPHKNKAAMFLIKHGADLSLKTENGDTALHLAATIKNVLIVKCLIEAGANLNVTRKNKGRQGNRYTPLHNAATAGSVSICALLIDHGASRDAKDGEKRTPLEMCIAEEKKALADPFFLFPDKVVMELLRTYVAGSKTYASFVEKDLSIAECNILALEVAKEEVDFSDFVGTPQWHEKEALLKAERDAQLQQEAEMRRNIEQIEQAQIPDDQASSVMATGEPDETDFYVAEVDVVQRCGGGGFGMTDNHDGFGVSASKPSE